jgi:glycosyltransferase involved in cell wall biosynthesis
MNSKVSPLFRFPYLKGRIHLIVTNWGYPFGGGEDFMYQTMEWAHQFSMTTVWLCFACAKTRQNYERSEIATHPYGTVIKLTGGMSTETIALWIGLLRPAVVHHQGFGRKICYLACSRTNTPFVTGIHFWNEIIELDPEKKNTKILENKELHQTHPDFAFLTGQPNCHFYSVSPYVSEVVAAITGVEIPFQVQSASNLKTCLIPYLKPEENDYVTVINYHQHKGGELILKILKRISNKIPFLLVRTEEGCDQFYREIDRVVADRGGVDRIIGRTKIGEIYRETRLLLVPSLVDETYCRVANEGLMNGIPIISTGYGNIRHLLGTGGQIISPEEPEKWIDSIEELWSDPKAYQEWQGRALDRYQHVSDRASRKAFRKMLTEIVAKSNRYRVMILSPWCDQGLGIQSRNYKSILESYGIHVSVFAIKPYDYSHEDLQKNPDEWVHHSLYYSPHDREHVKDEELLTFIRKHQVGKCLIPETCWYRIFQMAHRLQREGVECYAIPNIEIVRKDEIHKHEVFTKILCNNYLCQEVFTRYRIPNQYVGYGIQGVTFREKSWPAPGEPLVFTCIGGRNAFSRKQILEVCEAMVLAHQIDPSVRLIATIQKYLEDSIDKYRNLPFIDIVDHELSYQKILDLYYHNHVSIQVSKHEGLGIGFYESVSTGTPVITLQTPPHNEIIQDGVNGWTIPCHHRPMTDNASPLFDSAYFYPSHLAQKIVEISSNRSQLPELVKRLKEDLGGRLSFESFSQRFVESIFY